MPTFELSPAAEQDLEDIWLYIARDNLRAADKLLDRIEEQCKLLADHPQLGRARDDFARGLRYHPVANYLILYRIVRKGVDIVRVVHGARNLLDFL